MESKLSKKIDNFCQLNFSNQIVKNPKSIFYSKNVIQNPLNFKKKNEKISLKNLKQELSTTQNKNQHPKIDKIVQVQKQSLQITNCPRCKINNLFKAESSPRLVFTDSVPQQLYHSKSSISMKLHKSFSQNQQRDQTRRRYTMYEQKNNDFQKISISGKTRRVNEFPSKEDNSKDSTSLTNEYDHNFQNMQQSRHFQSNLYQNSETSNDSSSIFIVPEISIEESSIYLQSHKQWKGLDFFKSTISIHNKSEAHGELEQSFIIYNHLNEKITFKPISPLL